MPNLLIVGTNRIETYERSIERAFSKLGWTVDFWDPALELARVSRGKRPGRLLTSLIRIEPWLQKANLRLIQLVDRLGPDLILVIGTTGVRAGSLAQIRVRCPKTVIYCLYPDSPHNLDLDRIQCIPFFDRIATSSPAWVPAFRKFGAIWVSYLPFAADTEYFRPVTDRTQALPAYEVGFVGNWRQERAALLAQLTDFRLAIWGGDYWHSRVERDSPVRRVWQKRQAIGEEFAAICAQIPIMLNILDVVSWPGPNMRTFELPACRAFALSERSDAVLALFREGETIECFADVAEAQDKIRFYLAREAARQRIALAAYEFVTTQGHTYLDRARQLIAWWQADA